jgi:sarcosine oxidase gamma subunit
MQAAAAKINLIPAKVARLRGAEAAAVCDQDHGGVAVPVTGPPAGSFLEALEIDFRNACPPTALTADY